jgi:hypothetical protein
VDYVTVAAMGRIIGEISEEMNLPALKGGVVLNPGAYFLA